MSSLDLLPLGVGDAFSAQYYGCCLALRCDQQWLLIDCPHPIRKMMAEAGRAVGVTLDVGDLTGCVVTHLHADHSSGLEGLGYFSHFVVGRKARLILHPDVQERLWDGHLAAGMECLIDAHTWTEHRMRLEDYFELTALTTERAVEVGPFRIECRLTRHHIPTTALRIHAGGASIGISSDTTYDDGLIEWLAAADLVVHETNLGLHTDYERLAALPADLRARIRLIHYPDFFDREASAIEPLEQGRLYCIA